MTKLSQVGRLAAWLAMAGLALSMTDTTTTAWQE